MAKKALLIGVSQYEAGLPPLAAAPNDVQAMLRVLQNPELGAFDEVQPLVDPDLEAMQTAIARLFQSCQKGDTGLLYFSGHGITDDSDRLYLATRRTSKDTFKGNAVPASFIQDIMRGSSYQRQHVLILDCCYSGAFAEGWQAKSADVNVRQQLEVEGSVVLTSSTSTQKSFEQEGADLSLYTSYIVQGIESGAADRDRDGYISADELHEYAKQQVQAAKPAMKPEIYGARQGIKIVLAKAKLNRKLEYRRLVEKYAHNGEISIVGQDILELKREEWKFELSYEVATAIENEVLEPDRKRLKNLERYQGTLEKAVQQQFPLSAHIRVHLKDLQEALYLRDEDIKAIQDRVTAPYVEQEAELERQHQLEAEEQRQAELKKQQELEAERQRQEQREAEARKKQATSTAKTESKPRLWIQKIETEGFLGFGKKSIEIEMVSLPAGKFQMGSADGEGDDDERPQHWVNVPGFSIGKYSVTQAQWQAVMGTNPSNFKGEQQPVEKVSWHDVVKFCQQLSRIAEKKYRLPSEAEWEYACRAGSTTAYYFGNDVSQLDEYAWYSDNSGSKTHPVGQKKPNLWGLYDFHGNVWEWCQDEWHDNYNGAPTDGSAWETKGNENDNRSRLLRGGSWYFYARNCRSAYRHRTSADYWVDNRGFRVVCADA